MKVLLLIKVYKLLLTICAVNFENSPSSVQLLIPTKEHRSIYRLSLVILQNNVFDLKFLRLTLTPQFSTLSQKFASLIKCKYNSKPANSVKMVSVQQRLFSY